MSLVRIKNLKHQKQPCKQSCMAACLAMVTGWDIEGIILGAERRSCSLPLQDDVAFGMLVKADILPIKIDGLVSTAIEPDRIHLASRLSAHGPGLHCVVFVYDSDEEAMKVYDPSKNNVETYPNGELPFYPLSVEALYDCESYRAV